MLRTGQVRVDGKRAKSGLRLAAGPDDPRPAVGRRARPEAEQPKPAPSGSIAQESEELRARVLYRDDWLIVLDKPAGLAVQGGSGLGRHLDALSEALRFGAAEKPRLVHRLDKDTSGVLVLARTAAAARAADGGVSRPGGPQDLLGRRRRRAVSAARARIDLPLVEGRVGPDGGRER